MVIRNDGMMFFVAGINYRKCDMEIRGQYALPAKTIEKVLTKAKQCGIPEVFILSTCNRTEIYGLAHAADTLIHLLCEETRGDTTQFKKAAEIFVLDGFVTEHLEILHSQSSLYRSLSII